MEAERRKLEEAGTHFTCLTSTKVKILTPEEQILDTIYPLSTAGRQVFFSLSRTRSLALLALSLLSLAMLEEADSGGNRRSFHWWSTGSLSRSRELALVA